MKMHIFQALQPGQYICVQKGAGVERQELPQQPLLLVWQEVVNADYCPALLGDQWSGGVGGWEGSDGRRVGGRGSWAVGVKEGSKLWCACAGRRAR